MNDAIYLKVKQILSDTLKNLSADAIQPESKLKEELGLDSMSSLTFLMALEDNIQGFVIDPQTLEMDHLISVSTITQYIELQLERNTVYA